MQVICMHLYEYWEKQERIWCCCSVTKSCCCCLVTKSCPTLCDPLDCSRPGSSVLHYLPEFAQIHVHNCLRSSPIAFLTPSNLGGGAHLPVSYLFKKPFHTVHGVLTARILEQLAIPFSNKPRFVRALHYDHLSWVALHSMAHSFIELCKLLPPWQGCDP